MKYFLSSNHTLNKDFLCSDTSTYFEVPNKRAGTNKRTGLYINIVKNSYRIFFYYENIVSGYKGR